MLCTGRQKSHDNYADDDIISFKNENDNKYSSEVSTKKRNKQFVNNREENEDENHRVFLLDYENDLRIEDESSSVGYVLNKFYNSDFTHMNSAFLPHLECALERSGCNIDLI